MSFDEQKVDYLSSPDTGIPQDMLGGGGKEQTQPTTRERIIHGNGLEVVQEIGWTKFREELTTISYADIAQAQYEQSLALKEDNTSMSIPWITSYKNAEALQRSNQLSQFLRDNYPKGRTGFYAKQEGTKKIWVLGEKAVPSGNSEADSLVTRIYLAPPTAHLPEAFNSLFALCVDQGIIEDMDLALNLENFQANSLNKSTENNNIIAYVMGKKPHTLERLMKSLAIAKRNDPDLWKLNPATLASLKEGNFSSFMIPLDDTTAFVEMPDSGSYHAGPSSQMAFELHGGYGFNKISSQEAIQNLRSWTPQNPGTFVLNRLPERRKYMPALVFPPSPQPAP